MITTVQFIGIVLLSLLATVGFTIVFFGILPRFTHWLYSRHGVTMLTLKRLLGIAPDDIAEHGDRPSYDGKYEVWCERCFNKAYDGVSHFIRRTEINANRDCQANRKRKSGHTAIAIDFPCNRLPVTLWMFSISRHIAAIVNKLRRRVNQSGKEPAEAS